MLNSPLPVPTKASVQELISNLSKHSGLAGCPPLKARLRVLQANVISDLMDLTTIDQELRLLTDKISQLDKKGVKLDSRFYHHHFPNTLRAQKAIEEQNIIDSGLRPAFSMVGKKEEYQLIWSENNSNVKLFGEHLEHGIEFHNKTYHDNIVLNPKILDEIIQQWCQAERNNSRFAGVITWSFSYEGIHSYRDYTLYKLVFEKEYWNAVGFDFKFYRLLGYNSSQNFGMSRHLNEVILNESEKLPYLTGNPQPLPVPRA